MTTTKITIIGSYLSPYVRKVLATLEFKGLAYEIDSIVPFYGNDEFSKISPIRRIPVLMEGDVCLTDSSVICQYLEDKYPTPSLYPADIVQRAQARWLEEFADSRMGEVFIWHLFNQVAIKPAVWGEKANNDTLQKALQEEIPSVLDYLESQLPQQGFLFGDVSIADISIASFFRNAAFARFDVDSSRWPRTAHFVQHVLSLPCFETLKPFEDKLARTPVTAHRSALQAMGAPVTANTFGNPAPQRGVMKTE